jgi:hypothetical protein
MKALITLLFFISLCSVELLFGAGLDKNNPTNDQNSKKPSIDARYDFSISINTSNADFPESIVLTIKSNADSLSLNGLVFEFLTSNGNYWAVNDDFRFDKTPLKLNKNVSFCKEFKLDELQFISFLTKKQVSFDTFKETMLTNPLINVLATIGDVSKAKNPYESNLSSRSNVIEYTIQAKKSN